MGKKKANAKEEQPGYVTYLLEHGSVTMTATDREDFGDLIATIPASIRYGAGAIGRNSETGIFSLRIDLVK